MQRRELPTDKNFSGRQAMNGTHGSETNSDYICLDCMMKYVSQTPVEFVCRSQLNGANGEVTGKDDVPPRGRSRSRARSSSRPRERVRIVPPKVGAAQPGKRAVQRQRRSNQLKAQYDYLKADKGAMEKFGGKVIMGRGKYGMKKGGGNIGSRVGSKIGSWLGSAASSLLTSVIGVGDYAEIDSPVPIVNNSIMGATTPMAAQLPEMHKDKEMCIINHREYIADIGMTTAFHPNSFYINPCHNGTFPWLYKIAGQFQQYKILGMIFEFKSLSSVTTGENAGMGSVTMSVRYDVYQPAPTTKSQANNSMFAVSGRPSESLMCPIECDPNDTPMSPLWCFAITRTVAPVDQHEYIFGMIDIITQGASTPYSGAGELWVTYQVMLLKPIQSSPNALTFSHFPLDYADEKDPLVLYDITTGQYNGLGLEIEDSVTLTFPWDRPAGTTYLVFGSWRTEDTETKMEAPEVIDFSNGLSYAEDFSGGDDPEVNHAERSPVTASTGVGAAFMSFCITYDGTGSDIAPPRVNFGPGEVTNPNGGDLFVFEIPLETTGGPGRRRRKMEVRPNPRANPVRKPVCATTYEEVKHPAPRILRVVSEDDLEISPVAVTVTGHVPHCVEMVTGPTPQVRPRATGREVAKMKRLNGNNGSVTNTDDLQTPNDWYASLTDEGKEWMQMLRPASGMVFEFRSLAGGVSSSIAGLGAIVIENKHGDIVEPPVIEPDLDWDRFPECYHEHTIACDFDCTRGCEGSYSNHAVGCNRNDIYAPQLRRPGFVPEGRLLIPILQDAAAAGITAQLERLALMRVNVLEEPESEHARREENIAVNRRELVAWDDPVNECTTLNGDQGSVTGKDDTSASPADRELPVCVMHRMSVRPPCVVVPKPEVDPLMHLPASEQNEVGAIRAQLAKISGRVERLAQMYDLDLEVVNQVRALQGTWNQVDFGTRSMCKMMSCRKHATGPTGFCHMHLVDPAYTPSGLTQSEKKQVMRGELGSEVPGVDQYMKNVTRYTIDVPHPTPVVRCETLRERSQIAGPNGSWTGTDDVAIGVECPLIMQCNINGHWHHKARENKPKPKPEEKERAKKTRKNPWIRCEARLPADCGIAQHWHDAGQVQAPRVDLTSMFIDPPVTLAPLPIAHPAVTFGHDVKLPESVDVEFGDFDSELDSDRPLSREAMTRLANCRQLLSDTELEEKVAIGEITFGCDVEVVPCDAPFAVPLPGTSAVVEIKSGASQVPSGSDLKEELSPKLSHSGEIHVHPNELDVKEYWQGELKAGPEPRAPGKPSAHDVFVVDYTTLREKHKWVDPSEPSYPDCLKVYKELLIAHSISHFKYTHYKPTFEDWVRVEFKENYHSGNIDHRLDYLRPVFDLVPSANVVAPRPFVPIELPVAMVAPKTRFRKHAAKWIWEKISYKDFPVKPSLPKIPPPPLYGPLRGPRIPPIPKLATTKCVVYLTYQRLKDLSLTAPLIRLFFRWLPFAHEVASLKYNIGSTEAIERMPLENNFVTSFAWGFNQERAQNSSRSFFHREVADDVLTIAPYFDTRAELEIFPKMLEQLQDPRLQANERSVLSLGADGNVQFLRQYHNSVWSLVNRDPGMSDYLAYDMCVATNTICRYIQLMAALQLRREHSLPMPVKEKPTFRLGGRRRERDTLAPTSWAPARAR